MGGPRRPRTDGEAGRKKVALTLVAVDRRKPTKKNESGEKLPEREGFGLSGIS
jgi:hypothetical protein